MVDRRNFGWGSADFFFVMKKKKKIERVWGEWGEIKDGNSGEIERDWRVSGFAYQLFQKGSGRKGGMKQGRDIMGKRGRVISYRA